MTTSMTVIPRALHPTEAAFMAQVVRSARLLGYEVFHDSATNARRSCPHCRAILKQPRNTPGFPDLVLARAGSPVLFRELKVKGGRLTAEQRAWGDLLLAAGADWAVWTPDDWGGIAEQLR